MDKIQEIARTFADKFGVKSIYYWRLLDLKRDENMNYKDIHGRLERKGLDITYSQVYYWLISKLKRELGKTKSHNNKH